MPTEVLVEALRERRRSLLWWTLGLGALVALNVAFYPSVRDDPALSDYAKDLPESVRALFAGGELDIASPAGYLNSQIFALTAPLVLLIFSIGAGAGAVAGEEERGTLELVLAHPVRRRDFVVQRFLALAATVAALTLTLLATVAVGSRLVDLEIGFSKVLAATTGVGLLALLFGAVALATGGVRPGRTRAIAVAAGLAVAAWIFDGLAQSVDALEDWRAISPYYHALGQNPLREGAPWLSWALLVAVTAAFGAVAGGRGAGSSAATCASRGLRAAERLGRLGGEGLATVAVVRRLDRHVRQQPVEPARDVPRLLVQ
jgi:ABC-2 type transport system permease protein